MFGYNGESSAAVPPLFALSLITRVSLGQSEYWFATIKVVLAILFIIVGLIYDWGGVRHHSGPGLENFHNGQAIIGGFSALNGVELVSLAASESAKPHRAIPRAVRATFVRIVLFHILTILTIDLCID
ncbi:hypothetical protein POSPLADRAFT_1053383 [Postia placenta MAD-698-R-SB12]|uniref:Amino acid permease/ SLC12A domain-containing protein n=1 Tax=Postia placenta MAD-698-R-SB12 TaxID=670580 RepID=A0A1X6NEA0_9APHY|nr:hypothetical protein POSPLADRAFT_1053383 [Postia placenta MAD-698-R-SB12]OSX66766.1 hypothetical protein POSPLADRAFT_1053383 [Postia placenta MAD-698-R-SB12]